MNIWIREVFWGNHEEYNKITLDEIGLIRTKVMKRNWKVMKSTRISTEYFISQHAGYQVYYQVVHKVYCILGSLGVFEENLSLYNVSIWRFSKTCSRSMNNNGRNSKSSKIFLFQRWTLLTKLNISSPSELAVTQTN